MRLVELTASTTRTVTTLRSGYAIKCNAYAPTSGISPKHNFGYFPNMRMQKSGIP